MSRASHAAYAALFPRWRPRAELRPRARDGRGAAVVLRWLGTAAYAIETAATRLLIDPYLSRPSLGRVLAAPLVPDEAAIFARVRTRVDAVLCGHSHFDHLLDAPTIAARTGALLVGSATTCAFARASGVPEARLVEVPPEGKTLPIGDVEVRFVPSRHGRVLFGRVPLPGDVREVHALPARARAYRMGGAFGIAVRAPGCTVYHNGSADLLDAAIDGERVDVALVGLAGRRATPDYLARLVRALDPALVVPTHHDAFFAPLDDGLRLLPGIDLDGFVEDARRLAPRATVITPDYDEAIVVPPGDARGAAIVE